MKKSQQQLTLNRVKELCSDILDVVKFGISDWENDRGRMVPHIGATYIDYDGTEYEKLEPLDRWFSPEVFAIGLTQRADWLHASTEVKAACFNAKPMIHPAQYRKTMNL